MTRWSLLVAPQHLAHSLPCLAARVVAGDPRSAEPSSEAAHRPRAAVCCRVSCPACGRVLPHVLPSSQFAARRVRAARARGVEARVEYRYRLYQENAYVIFFFKIVW